MAVRHSLLPAHRHEMNIYVTLLTALPFLDVNLKLLRVLVYTLYNALKATASYTIKTTGEYSQDRDMRPLVCPVELMV